jgi:hypothetical protein
MGPARKARFRLLILPFNPSFYKHLALLCIMVEAQYLFN